MKKSQHSSTQENCIALFFDVLAIFVIKSLFESDDSKIISEKGKSLLLDKKQMNDINAKIDRLGKSGSYKEVVI